MRDIIQQDAGDGVGLENLLGSGELFDPEEIVFPLIDQRNEGVEASRFILEFPETEHVVDPVGPRLHMAEKHRGVALPAASVPAAVDIEPLFGADFSLADVVADLFVEDLRSAAGHRVDSALDHQVDHLVVTQPVALGEEVHLGGSERFDVQCGMGLFDLSEGSEVPIEARLGVVRRDDVDLSGSLGDGFVGDGQDLFVAQRILVGVFPAGAVGAEFADVFADVGGIDVAVDVEITLAPVFRFPDPRSEVPEAEKVQLVERFRFLGVEAFTRFDFRDRFLTLLHRIAPSCRPICAIITQIFPWALPRADGTGFCAEIFPEGKTMRTLNADVEKLLGENAPDFEIAKAIKRYLKDYFATLPDLFAETGGKDFLFRHTRTIDAVIKLIYKVALRENFGQYLPLKNHIPLTLVALGSYGREQLCLYSDIDLMMVYEETPGYRTKALIEKILYLLWDTGLKLGHRVHEVSELPEVARSDITIKTAILESRFLDGSRFLWTGIENRIKEIRLEDPDSFIREKVEERRRHHRQYPLTMEPNIKEGVGGFRDANMVYWVGKALHNVPRIQELDASIVDSEDYREFRSALEFLFRLRSALHIVTGKKTDQIRLELLPDLARLLKFESSYRGQLRLARRVTGHLKTIHLYSEIWLEKLIGTRLPELYADRLLPETRPRKLQTHLEGLRRHADRSFRPHPRLLDSLIHAERPERPDTALYRELGRLFERAQSHAVLETLSEARLLGYLIPPMKKVIDLPQFDGYHRYAVDRHSLETLRHLENIDDPRIRELYDALGEEERRTLKIVALLHDAGKGRKRDHHQVGASLFRIFAQKLDLSPSEISRGERLILHHTLMSVTAQREDIYSEKVVMRFASRFGSKTMLDRIYLLTYADMKGVGTDVYNAYTAKLLRTLYKGALESLRHENRLDEASKRMAAVDRLQRSRAFKALPKALRSKVLGIGSDAFFIRHSTKRIVAIAQEAWKTEEYRYHIGNSRYLTIEIIRRHDLNLAYLLAKLSRLQVVSMEIIKLFDGLKYFKIDFNERLDESEIPLLEKIIEDSFTPHPALQLRKPEVHPEDLEVDCEHSQEYGMLKLRTADQPGLLAYLIALFDALGVDIASAKIHTLKGKTNDLFLIEKNGNFCHNIKVIVEKLTETTCVES